MSEHNASAAQKRAADSAAGSGTGKIGDRLAGLLASAQPLLLREAAAQLSSAPRATLVSSLLSPVPLIALAAAKLLSEEAARGDWEATLRDISTEASLASSSRAPHTLEGVVIVARAALRAAASAGSPPPSLHPLSALYAASPAAAVSALASLLHPAAVDAPVAAYLAPYALETLCSRSRPPHERSRVLACLEHCASQCAPGLSSGICARLLAASVPALLAAGDPALAARAAASLSRAALQPLSPAARCAAADAVLCALCAGARDAEQPASPEDAGCAAALAAGSLSPAAPLVLACALDDAPDGPERVSLCSAVAAVCADAERSCAFAAALCVGPLLSAKLGGDARTAAAASEALAVVEPAVSSRSPRGDKCCVVSAAAMAAALPVRHPTLYALETARSEICPVWHWRRAPDGPERVSLCSAVAAVCADAERSCAFAAALCVGPLLSAKLGGDARTAAAASEALAVVEPAVSSRSPRGDKCCVVSAAAMAAALPVRHPTLYALETARSEICPVWHSQGDEAVLWLRSMADKMASASEVTRTLLLFLQAFLVHPREDVAVAALAVARRAAELAPEAALSLLPVLLRLLFADPKTGCVLAVLEILPLFAASWLCVTNVLRVVAPLLKQPELFPALVRVLCAVWKREKRVFSVLFPEINKYSPEMPAEARLAVAACLRDVCELDAARGLDLIDVVSRVLGNASESEAAVSLALDSLRLLCVSDAVDPLGAWSIVAPSFGGAGEARPLVLRSLAQFFACGAPTMAALSQDDTPKSPQSSAEKPPEPAAAAGGAQSGEGEGEEEEEEGEDENEDDGGAEGFARECFQRLWALRVHADPRVRSAALQSLSAFPAAQLAPLLLEGDELARLALDSACAEPARAVASVPCRLEGSRRGPLPSSLSSSASPVQRVFSDVSKFVRSACARATPANRTAAAAAACWASPSWGALEDALATLDSGTDWCSRLTTLGAFCGLWRGMLGPEPASTAQGVVRKALEACAALRAQSPASGENCCVALGALALSLPPQSRVHAAAIHATVSSWVEEADAEQSTADTIRCGLRVASACTSAALARDRPSEARALALALGDVCEAGGDCWQALGAAVGVAVLCTRLADVAMSPGASTSPAADECRESVLETHERLLSLSDPRTPAAAGCVREGAVDWGRFGAALALSYAAQSASACSGSQAAVDEALGVARCALRALRERSAAPLWSAAHCLSVVPLASSSLLAGTLPPASLAELFDDLCAAAADDEAPHALARSCACLGAALLAHSAACAGVDVGLARALELLVAASACAVPSVSSCAVLAAGCLLGADACAPLGAPAHVPRAVVTQPALSGLAQRVVEFLRSTAEAARGPAARAALWALGSLSRGLPAVAESSAHPDTAFEGSPVCRALFCLADDPRLAGFALGCLASAQRLPPVAWSALLLRVANARPQDEAVRADCVRFVESRLAAAPGGAVPREVAAGLVQLLCGWLDASAVPPQAPRVQELLVRAIPPLARVSPADGLRVCAGLLQPVPFSKMAETARAALLESAEALTKCEVPLPPTLLADVHRACLSLLSSLESPVRTSARPPALDERLARACTAVAACLSALGAQQQLERFLSDSLGDAEAALKSAVVCAGLVERGCLQARSVGPARRWCFAADPRSGPKHAAALLAALEVACALPHAASTADSLDSMRASASMLVCAAAAEAASMTPDLRLLCLPPHSRRVALAAVAGRTADASVNGFLSAGLARECSGQAMAERAAGMAEAQYVPAGLRSTFASALVGAGVCTPSSLSAVLRLLGQ
eukprot:m51a1_g4114 hypothetical protein (1788) ;mRNA; f:135526-141534